VLVLACGRRCGWPLSMRASRGGTKVNEGWRGGSAASAAKTVPGKRIFRQEGRGVCGEAGQAVVVWWGGVGLGNGGLIVCCGSPTIGESRVLTWPGSNLGNAPGGEPCVGGLWLELSAMMRRLIS